MKRWILRLLVCAWVPLGVQAAGGSAIPLDKAPIDLTDYASLQRGAKLYVNHCQGCHGLKFMRYDSLGKGIGITDESGELLQTVMKEQLMFVGTKLSDYIESAMDPEDAASWFGAPPPDLSLVSRSRGVDWLYTYMRTFYADPTRTWGVNNLVYPDVGMPHILSDLQGIQEPVFRTKRELIGGKWYEEDIIDGLKLVKSGTLSVAEYDQAMADLVNFLSYVGEPVQIERQRIGVWVLVFLGIFLVFTVLLKREYWKDVH